MRIVCLSLILAGVGACTELQPLKSDIKPPAVAATAQPATRKVDRPVTQPALGAVEVDLLPAEIRKALEAVSSSKDPADRAAALGVIKKWLDQVPATQPAMMNTQLLGDIRLLLAGKDEEVKGRARDLLDFNEGLALFTADAMRVAEPQRHALLSWAYTDAGVSVAGRAFSPRVETRVRTARELAALPGEQADWLLGHLILDNDRMVCLTALDVAGDRKPTPVLVDALFDKAVIFSLRQYGIPMGPEIGNTSRQVTIHGRTIYVYNYNRQQSRQADSDVAAEILASWKSPLVAARLTGFLHDLAALKEDGRDMRFTVFSGYSGTLSINLSQLMEAYHPKALISLAAEGAFGPMGESYEPSFNGQVYHASSRLDAMGLLLTATGQDVADYGLVRIPQYGNRWLVVGNAAAEEAANKKLKTWWKTASAQYMPASTGPATQP